MNLVLKIGLEALATKRLARLAVDDTIMQPVRVKIWEKSPPEKIGVGYVFTCHACSSVWAAALVRSGILPPFLRDTLALSELALIAKKALQD